MSDLLKEIVYSIYFELYLVHEFRKMLFLHCNEMHAFFVSNLKRYLRLRKEIRKELFFEIKNPN
jgi:hypothetical protein